MGKHQKSIKIVNYGKNSLFLPEIFGLYLQKTSFIDSELRRVLKMKLARWHSWPIKSKLFENQPIRG